jgi:lysophospholipase L1-like esterase
VTATRRRELVLLAVSLAVVLGLAELGLRIAGYRYSPLKVLTPLTETDWRFAHVFQSADFTFDPELIWRPLPGHGVFNTQGFRGQEVRGAKPAGTVRLLTVGDSNTLGHQGQHGANWPLLMETLDPHLFVINAGVYGYSSFQGVRRLREVLRYQPDAVLISFGANDGHLVGTTDADYAQRLAHRKGLLSVLTISRLGQLVIDALDKLEARQNRGAQPVRRVSLDDYRQNVREMVRLCLARGARPVLLTRPFEGHTHDPESWKSVGPDYNQVTREVGAEMKVPVIDVYREFKRRKDLFEDESHFTREGHWEAARFVYGELAPILARPE